MGGCHSTGTATHNHAPEECFMCCHAATPYVKLACGHALHVPCAAAWWVQTPHLPVRCPLCRQASDECIMEIETTSRIPVGFYRTGFINRIGNLRPHVTTEFVKIKDDGDARERAQAMTLLVWELLKGADTNASVQ